MKAISLTALAVAAYLILTNLLTPAAATSRKSITFSSVSDLLQKVAPQSAPATGYSGQINRVAAPLTRTAQNTNPETGQTFIDVPAPDNYEAEAALESDVVDSAAAVATAVDQTAAVEVVPVEESAPAEDVPATTGVMAEPVALAEANVFAEAPVEVVVAEDTSAQLDAFIAGVVNGQAGQVVGVFAQDLFALPVIQQPAGQANFVSTENGKVTQFAAPSAHGTIGLLAHNYLSGKLFFSLGEGQELVVVYGDGQRQVYRISYVQRFQALEPLSAYSNFIDVNDPSQTQISASTLFSRVYGQPDRLVLQTCIEANGDYSWGRLFITAEKVN